MRGSFSVYRSTYEALMAYPPEMMKEAFRFIGQYALDGVEPDVTDGIAYGLYCSVKPLIERSHKNAEAGRAGGSKPKQKKAEVKQTEAKTDEYAIHYAPIINYLNRKAGTNYKSSSDATRSRIRARLKEGFTEKDFATVIDKKVAEWNGTEQEKYLRPETLFGTKFESYLNQNIVRQAATKFDNFTPEHTEDELDELTRRIIESQEL